ncbi:RNA polymerase sigma factor [Crocinitomix catalasitica]|nr:RNA polymerase sigma factor [Crocinitomix catalasitica]
MTLDEIIKGCIKRDNKARMELYKMFSAQMFSLALRYSSNRKESEEIFQQAFLLIYENIGQLKNPQALAGWVKRIFINTAIHYQTQEKRFYKIVDPELSKQDAKIANDVLDEIAAAELTELIQQLPDKSRRVFNLYAVEGYSHKEISEIMKISVGTSKSQLFDARKALMKWIKKMNSSRLAKVI